MAWLELLMCSLRESKFTELIKLQTLIKVIIEQGEVSNSIRRREGREGHLGERQANGPCRKESSFQNPKTILPKVNCNVCLLVGSSYLGD